MKTPTPDQCDERVRKLEIEIDRLKRGMLWCEKCEWYTHCKLGCAIESNHAAKTDVAIPIEKTA